MKEAVAKYNPLSMTVIAADPNNDGDSRDGELANL